MKKNIDNNKRIIVIKSRKTRHILFNLQNSDKYKRVLEDIRFVACYGVNGDKIKPENDRIRHLFLKNKKDKTGNNKHK